MCQLDPERGANTAMELTVALPTVGGVGEPLLDYVDLRWDLTGGAPTIDRACYTIEGNPRQWRKQRDGPVMQTSAVLRAYDQLAAAGQQTARQVTATNVA